MHQLKNSFSEKIKDMFKYKGEEKGGWKDLTKKNPTDFEMFTIVDGQQASFHPKLCCTAPVFPNHCSEDHKRSLYSLEVLLKKTSNHNI